MSKKNPTDDIVLTPDPRLSKVCEPIEEINDEVRELARRMLVDMYASDGCGLAAPQVGENVRLVVIDCDYADEDGEENPYVLINPEVVVADGDPRPFNEGCLSFPGISVTVERPSHVIVRAHNLDGDLMQYEAEGNLMAVCLQHEIDHLNGKTLFESCDLAARVKAMADYEAAKAAGAKPGETSAPRVR